MSGPRFEPLYYRERVHLVNPYGDVGILTLWSELSSVRNHLEAAARAVLDPDHSRVAAIASLYGDGMYAMFCNILYNPQIRHLVALGQDRGLPTCREIEAFLEDGLEDTVMLGTRMRRIIGTDRVFPAHEAFDERRLRDALSFRYLGRLGPGLSSSLRSYLDAMPRSGEPPQTRVRVEMEMSVGDNYSYRPSEVTAHQVVRAQPLQCWKELVVRVIRFGRPVPVGSDQRLELLNVKAVITAPAEKPADTLAAYGFSLAGFRRYQETMLKPDPPEGDLAYTCGHRLGDTSRSVTATRTCCGRSSTASARTPTPGGRTSRSGIPRPILRFRTVRPTERRPASPPSSSGEAATSSPCRRRTASTTSCAPGSRTCTA